MTPKKRADLPGYQVTINDINNMKLAMSFQCMGDGFVENLPIRYLILVSGERIEIPCSQYIIKFSEKRNELFKKGEQTNV